MDDENGSRLPSVKRVRWSEDASTFAATAPRRTLIAGVVISIVAAAFVIVVPSVADWASVTAAGEGQTFRVALEFVVRIVREVAAPLGAALIAASIAMRYIYTLLRRA